jgi:hypothetical protein
MVLFTPPELLELSELPEARKILPDVCGSFDELYELREEIRLLRLLPVKAQADREQYKSLNQAVLLEELVAELGDRKLALLPNRFPYFLPPDVNQRLLWVAGAATNDELHSFIVREVNDDRVIVFERPLNAVTPLVKGTFKHLRHLHVWTKSYL